jgi:hypothetical protein
MDTALPRDVSLALAALRSRALRELDRVRGTTVIRTEIVGGWAKLGSCLDALLRNAFIAVCSEAMRAPDTELQRLSGQSTWLVTRATAGQFRFVLPRLAQEFPPHDPLVRAIVAACNDDGSPLRRVIETRNTMVHDLPPPPPSTLVHLLTEFAAWCDALS